MRYLCLSEHFIGEMIFCVTRRQSATGTSVNNSVRKTKEPDGNEKTLVKLNFQTGGTLRHFFIIPLIQS